MNIYFNQFSKHGIPMIRLLNRALQLYVYNSISLPDYMNYVKEYLGYCVLFLLHATIETITVSVNANVLGICHNKKGVRDEC